MADELNESDVRKEWAEFLQKENQVIGRLWFCSIEERRFPFTSNILIMIKYLDDHSRKLDPSAWTTVVIDAAGTLREAHHKLVNFAEWLGAEVTLDGHLQFTSYSSYWVAQ